MTIDDQGDPLDVRRTLAELTERLDAVADENRRLRHEVAALRSERRMTTLDGTPDNADVLAFEAPRSRRRFFAAAAVIAGGAAAGASTFGRAAAAANPPMLLNEANAATLGTTVTADLGSDVFDSVFGATNANTARGTGLFGYGESYGTLGFSANGTGVFGKASGGPGEEDAFATGVAGYIDNPLGLFGRGVAGTANGPTQIGVIGVSDEGVGVKGDSHSGRAVVGESALGVGGDFTGKQAAVQGTSQSGTAGVFNGGFADLALGGLRVTPPTTDPAFHFWGDIVMQGVGASDATLWMCVTSGTPGKWRRIQASNAVGALTLLAAPVRVYDSRPGRSPVAIGPKTMMTAGSDRPVDCTPTGVSGLSGVPSDATAVLITLTAVNQSASGFLAVRATSTPYTNTSNMNWSTAGQTVGNQITTACAAGPYITLRLGGPPGSTANVIVDLVGYYR